MVSVFLSFFSLEFSLTYCAARLGDMSRTKYKKKKKEVVEVNEENTHFIITPGFISSGPRRHWFPYIDSICPSAEAVVCILRGFKNELLFQFSLFLPLHHLQQTFDTLFISSQFLYFLYSLTKLLTRLDSNMPSNLIILLTVLTILAFCLHDSGVYAFGAGNIPR